MNFFKLYIGDYQRDTAHLSVTEHGAFLLMLQHYYATERPLPTGKALHRMLRAQDKAEREAIDSVAVQFWRTTEAGLVNDRADAEITKAGAQAETNRGIARAREAARKAAREEHESCTNRASEGLGATAENGEKVAEKSRKSGSADDAAAETKSAQVVDLHRGGGHESCTNRATNGEPNHSHSHSKATARAVIGDSPADVQTEVGARPPDRPHASTQAGEACRAMHEAGVPLQSLNPQHAELLAALEAGATPAEFGATAAELVARGKQPHLAYIVRTVMGRRTEALERARGAPQAASVGVAARFDGKTYTGASDDELERFFGRA